MQNHKIVENLGLEVVDLCLRRKNCSEKIFNKWKQNYSPNDTLVFFNGGGNLNDIWTKINYERVEAFRILLGAGYEIIMLPQSISFCNIDYWKSIATANMLGSTEMSKNLHIISRDFGSYFYLDEAEQKGWIRLGSKLALPDSAYQIELSDEFIESQKRKAEYDVLWVQRSDVEKATNYKVDIDFFAKNGYTVKVLDWLNIKVEYFFDQ